MLREKLMFSMLPYVGDKTGKKILSYLSAEEVIADKGKSLKNIPGIQTALLRRIELSINEQLVKRADKEIEFMEKNGVQMIFYTDSDYPSRLKFQDDSPNLFFYKGQLPNNPLRTLAVVGTRQATDYGAQLTHRLLNDLKTYGITLVSGLAYGIDTIAHRESLKMNFTNIAVLAHGFHTIYPPLNYNLAAQIENQGCLISEFRSETKPDRENFPRRNRIVAALSDAIVVVESAKRGGALITAELANGYNKDVFAFPGDVGKKLSEGCNNLINANKAALISGGEDILKMMNWEENSGGQQTSLFAELNVEEQAIVDFLRKEEQLHFDHLVAYNQIKPGKLSGLLLELEFKGVITPLPGNRYRLS